MKIKKKIEKRKNNYSFYFTDISPKWKNAIMEMALESFILYNVDHEVSKSWKQIAARGFETTTKFDRVKN